VRLAQQRVKLEPHFFKLATTLGLDLVAAARAAATSSRPADGEQAHYHVALHRRALVRLLLGPAATRIGRLKLVPDLSRSGTSMTGNNGK
jgi:hypothetical protein